MEKPGFGISKKLGFLCKQINLQQPYPPISPKNQIYHDFSSSEGNPVLLLKSKIIMLSGGKTGFLNLRFIYDLHFTNSKDITAIMETEFRTLQNAHSSNNIPTRELLSYLQSRQ
jgi:hypothetical protein